MLAALGGDRGVGSGVVHLLVAHLGDVILHGVQLTSKSIRTNVKPSPQRLIAFSKGLFSDISISLLRILTAFLEGNGWPQ
jgi:hypothetical protein